MNAVNFLNQRAPRPGIGEWFIGTLPEKVNYLMALVAGLTTRLHHEGNHEQADDIQYRAWVMDANYRVYFERVEVAVINYTVYVQDLENGHLEFRGFEERFVLALLRLTTLLAMRGEIVEEIDDLIAEVEAEFGVNPWQGED